MSHVDECRQKPGGVISVKLKAYFDESGHSSDAMDRAFAIGGALGLADQWFLLEEEWKKILDHFNVRVFHATDFRASRGEFKGWGEDEPKRRQFLGGLLNVIKKYVAVPIGAAVPIVSFKLLTGEEQEALIGPYFLCFQVCLGSTALESVGLSGASTVGDVDVVFAHAPKLVGKADQLAQAFMAGAHPLRHKIRTVTFGSPKDCPPLQVADLIAFELAQYLHGNTLRYPMQELLSMQPEFTFLPSEEIRAGFV